MTWPLTSSCLDSEGLAWIKNSIAFFFFLNFSWQQTSHGYRKLSQTPCVANESEEAQRVRWQKSHLWRPSIYFAKKGQRLESLWVVVCPHCVEQIVTHGVDKSEEILHFSRPVVFVASALKGKHFIVLLELEESPSKALAMLQVAFNKWCHWCCGFRR